MRIKFDEQLDLLNSSMISMGAMCESAIACSVKSLSENGTAYAEDAENAEKEIDRRERDIETLCMRLLLQQQPVARDLRIISSALKMVTDMERIGDQAADIAELSGYVRLSDALGGTHINEMTSAVINMVTDSIDAFVQHNTELAEAVIAADDHVDELFAKIKSELISLIEKKTVNGEEALDTLMIAKYLERIGDHATNIAEWVYFSIAGIRYGEK